MTWHKPDFKEIGLAMEVTAYVNQDELWGPTTETASPRSESPLIADERTTA